MELAEQTVAYGQHRRQEYTEHLTSDIYHSIVLDQPCDGARPTNMLSLQ